MSSMEDKNDILELAPEELEKISGGSWLGRIWNKIKSFGGDSGSTDVTDSLARP